jgi:hypothetical protein
LGDLVRERHDGSPFFIGELGFAAVASTEEKNGEKNEQR